MSIVLHVLYFLLWLQMQKSPITYCSIHLGPKETEQDLRFDTLISPSGTVAALTKILKDEGIKDKNLIAYDQGTLSYVQMQKEVFRIVSDRLHHTPSGHMVLLFSLSLYNSFPTYQLIKELREKYQNSISMVLGGQHLTWMEKVMKEGKNPFHHREVDHILGGSGEVQLPRLVDHYEHGEPLEKISFLSHSDEKGKKSVFSTMEYRHFYHLKERLEEQKQVAGFTQICRQGQGGPGCSWAANNQQWACNFCALQNITQMNGLSLEKNLREQYTMLQNIKEECGIRVDRIFMVDNNFSPYITPKETKKRLEHLIQEKKQREEKIYYKKDLPRDQQEPLKYYAYLTENSLNEEVLPLYKKLGLEEVYVGFDHFHPYGAKEQNKNSQAKTPASQEAREHNKLGPVDKKYPRISEKLDLLQQQGIKVRRGNVMGAIKETEETLESFYEVIQWASDPKQWYVVFNKEGKLDQAHSTILAIGIFPIEILPWSRAFQDFVDKIYDTNQQRAEKQEAKALFDFLKEYGYRTRAQQLKAQKYYINHYSPEMGYQKITEMKNAITDLLEKRDLLGYTVDKNFQNSKNSPTHQKSLPASP